jgi:hypothetical protein
MTDSYRITGKSETLSGDPLYLVDFEIKRSLLIDKANLDQILQLLGEGEENRSKFGQLDELISLIKTAFQDEVYPNNVTQIRSPWRPIKFSNEGISRLAVALGSQDEEVTLHSEGTPDEGGMKLTTIIAGAPFTRVVTSSKQAKEFADSMSSFSRDAIVAGVKGKLIERLASIIDWALRAAGVYELAEKAWESAQKAIEARREQDKSDKFQREHLEREKKAGIERAEQWDFADRVSRTA